MIDRGGKKSISVTFKIGAIVIKRPIEIGRKKLNQKRERGKGEEAHLQTRLSSSVEGAKA